MKKIKGSGTALEKKKGGGGRLKRIPTKPERRLSPSALGKGQLEGSGLRRAKRILLLQSCQDCIHYISIENGVEKCVYLMLHKKKKGWDGSL